MEFISPGGPQSLLGRRWRIVGRGRRRSHPSRGRSSLGVVIAVNGDSVTFHIHAQEIRVVVTPLSYVVRTRCIAGARCAPEEQPAASAYRCAGTHLARGTANKRACSCPQGRADDSARHRSLLRGLLAGHSAHLLIGKLTAHGIVGAKLVEALTSAGKSHDTGPGRDGRACRKR